MLLGVAATALSVPACQASFKAGGTDEPAAAPPPPPPSPPATAPPAAEQPPPAAPQKSKVELKGGTIKLPGNIVFDFDKATLKQGVGNDEILEQLRLFLVENPQVTKVRIEGHTDNAGEDAYNEKLSGDRALAIKRWLVDHQIAKERIIAVGFGESKPIANNNTEEGRAQNRRTEFKIAELKGKPYLGMDPTAGGKVFDL
jgi:OOP family OmpA-OmpF porin